MRRALLALSFLGIVSPLAGCADRSPDDTQSSVGAATVPSGFTDLAFVSGLSSPTLMEFAPDGRLFVSEQGGRLRVIKNGALLSKPFLQVSVSTTGKRG